MGNQLGIAMNITIEIKGSAVNAVADLAAKMDNLSSAMAEAGAYVERETKSNFLRQSSPDGAPWQALAPATLRRKRGSGILRESGALMAGISMSSGKLEARVTSTGPAYNIFHQSGGSKLPQRKFIGLSDRYIEPVTAIIRNSLGL